MPQAAKKSMRRNFWRAFGETSRHTSHNFANSVWLESAARIPAFVRSEIRCRTTGSFILDLVSSPCALRASGVQRGFLVFIVARPRRWCRQRPRRRSLDYAALFFEDHPTIACWRAYVHPRRGRRSPVGQAAFGSQVLRIQPSGTARSSLHQKGLRRACLFDCSMLDGRTRCRIHACHASRSSSLRIHGRCAD